MANVFYEGLIPPPNAAAAPNNPMAGQPAQPVEVDQVQLSYTNNFVTYQTPQYIKGECNAILFYNSAGPGGSNMIVNGLPFAPGNGIAFNGNIGEIDVTNYTLGFDNTGINQATVVRTIYNQ
jgi:hypothetical protein